MSGGMARWAKKLRAERLLSKTDHDRIPRIADVVAVITLARGH
jgi:hypothetical protein